MKLCQKSYAILVLLGVLLGLIPAGSAQNKPRGLHQGRLKKHPLFTANQNDLAKATLSLQVGNSYFLPAINFSGGFTNGEGGRSLAVPVGDMLNPVYAMMNEMTEDRPFPQVENMEQSFFPKNLYDAHVRTTLPLLIKDLCTASKLPFAN